MNEMLEPMNFWVLFKEGRPEAFHYVFHLYNSRIYYYLLRLLRDEAQAREVTKYAFVVLFQDRAQIEDIEHLLRRLYLNARVGYLLRLKDKASLIDLEEEALKHTHKDATIMNDPEVAQNEMLLALHTVTQKLPPIKRQVAELYFFQGFSVGAIARRLKLDEVIVRSIISEILRYLG